MKWKNTLTKYHPGFLGLLLLSSCTINSTSIRETWTNPNAKPLLFTKIFVVAPLATDSQRRTAEDAIATKIKSAPAVPSYTVLSLEELKDIAVVKAKVKEIGCDGAILVRKAGEKIDKEVYRSATYTPQPFWDQYSYGFATSVTQTHVIETKMIQVETKIFSLNDEMLVWSGLTESADPGSLIKLINEMAPVISDELRRKQLIR